jgi:hypothetical protein
LRKITREEPPKNPSEKEKLIKEKTTTEKVTKESTIVKGLGEKEKEKEKLPSEEKKEKEKLEDKPETPKKKNLKHKANEVIGSKTKDPNTLVRNKVVKNIPKSIPRSRKRKTRGIKTREILNGYYNYKISKE